MLFVVLCAFTASAAPPSKQMAKYEFKVNAAVEAGVTVEGILLNKYALNGQDHFIINTIKGVVDVTVLDTQVFALANKNEVLVLPSCRMLHRQSERKAKTKPIPKADLGNVGLIPLYSYRC